MDEVTQKIEIYKAYISTIIASDNHRQRVAAYYLGMILVLATVARSSDSLDPLFVWSLVFLTALIWCCTIRRFLDKAEAQLCVIEELEREIGFAAFQLELEEFRKRSKVKRTLAELEMSIPKWIAIGSLIAVVVQLVGNLLLELSL